MQEPKFLKSNPDPRHLWCLSICVVKNLSAAEGKLSKTNELREQQENEVRLDKTGAGRQRMEEHAQG